MSTPIEPPQDLRAELREVIFQAWEIGIARGRTEYLEGEGPMLHEEQKIDDILRLCEAVALAALPEKYPVGQPGLAAAARALGANEAVTTAQANIHSVFGGKSNE